MTDLHHYIGDDLGVSATGDLRVTEDDTIEGQQRLLRRLLTNSAMYDVLGNVTAIGDNLFHQDYGASAGRHVGDTLGIPAIRSTIRKQIFNEAIVARFPEPVIAATAIDKGVSVSIQYTDSSTGKQTSLNFDITQ
jgi:hypothetical protein